MNIHAQRLLNVAKACRQTPYPQRFTMETFVHPCGTPACAVGNYAARRDLQDAFVLKGEDIVRMTSGGYPSRSDYSNHFGITSKEWDELFTILGCGGARTPEAAAKYIEGFVARKWPAPPAPDWAAMAAKWTVGDDVKSQELVS